MALDLRSLERALAQLDKSLAFVESSLARQDAGLREQFRAAAIQAFEYAYELAWKMLKRRLEEDAPAPAEVAARDEPPSRAASRGRRARDPARPLQTATFGPSGRARTAGASSPFSDLDLAVIGGGNALGQRCAALRRAFEDSSLPFRVDVVEWASLDEAFRDLIRRQSVVVQKSQLAPVPEERKAG